MNQEQPAKLKGSERILPSDADYADTLLESWSRTLPDVDASAVPLFSMATALGRQMELFLESVVKPQGYQLSEYRLLVALLTQGKNGMTPVQLNKVLRLTSAGATKTIARLESRGLIQRRPNPVDNRSVLLELTPEAEREVRNLCTQMAQAQNRKIAWLSAQQMETALEGLRVLLQALN